MSNDEKRARQRGPCPLSLIFNQFLEASSLLPPVTMKSLKYDQFLIDAVDASLECHSWLTFSILSRSNIGARQRGLSPLLLILAGFE